MPIEQAVDLEDPWGAAAPGTAFTAARVAELARQADLHYPESVLGAVTAALRCGKHVILTGPPGTGKSSLARIVAQAGQEALMCTGLLSSTATSDWTVADTVGTGVDNIGPAIFLDAAEYAAIRLCDRADPSLVLLEAFTAYLLPQLDPLDAGGFERLLAILDGALAPPEQEAVRGLLVEFSVLSPDA